MSILFGPLPVYFLVELVDENRDQFWVHELIPQPIQDLGFQLIPPHREEVVTRAFVSGGGATVVELTDFREPATTIAAFEQTREKIARPARTLRADAIVLGHDPRSDQQP